MFLRLHHPGTVRNFRDIPVLTFVLPHRPPVRLKTRQRVHPQALFLGLQRAHEPQHLRHLHCQEREKEVAEVAEKDKEEGGGGEEEECSRASESCVVEIVAAAASLGRAL